MTLELPWWPPRSGGDGVAVVMAGRGESAAVSYQGCVGAGVAALGAAWPRKNVHEIMTLDFYLRIFSWRWRGTLAGGGGDPFLPDEGQTDRRPLARRGMKYSVIFFNEEHS